MITEEDLDYGLEGILNLHYPLFYKKNVTRQIARLQNPVFSKTENYFLPRASAIHFIPETSHEYGIDMSHSLMRHIGDRALVYHIEKMDIKAGNARHLSISPETMIRNYHKRYRNLVRVRNIDKSNINDHLHMVVNYALLPHLYVQVHSSLQIYQEWFNIRSCMWNTIKELGPIRYHFIPFKVPKFLPGKTEFKRFAEGMNLTGLKHFHSNETFDLLELWKIIEDVSNGKPAPLEKAILEKTNLVFIESGQLTTINFNDLINWAISEPNLIMNKFYIFMDRLLTMKSATITTSDLNAITVEPESTEENLDVELEMTHIDSILHKDKNEHDAELEQINLAEVGKDVDEEEEIKIEEVVADSNLSAVEEKIAERALSGTLSGAEQRGLLKLSERWKVIHNPFNPKETLADVVITKEDLLLKDEPFIRDSIAIHDKSLLKSRVNDFDKHYIKNVHNKDLLKTCLSIQNAGLIVKDLTVTEKNTAVTRSKTFSIQVQPVTGQVSTLKFTIPTLEEDGTFMCGSVVRRMDKLRTDPPILKTKPYTVALTSYYGKVFIVRNQNAATNYGRWLKSKIVKASIDNEDGTITKVIHGINKFKGVKLPRAYTAVAEELNAFSTPKYDFFFNYKKLDTFFNDQEIKFCGTNKLIPCARSTMTANIILAMDKYGAIYEVKENKIEVISSLPTLLNPEWGEGPLEYAEVGIFNRRIPIILALIYKKGLEKTFTDLGIQYTRIPPTARYAATPNTYRLKFKDESFVIDVRNPEIKLLVAGFNSVRKNITDYNSQELNKRSSFSYLLSGSGITQQHLRELLLMYDMFVDPITKELLEDMNEPTTFEGLLVRSNQMLISDWVPEKETSLFKGYERFAGMAYSQIVQSIRGYRSRGNVLDAEITMNPSAVFLDIIQDQSVTLIEDSNPIHNLKEKEAVTFSGKGGRSTLTMVKETRGFTESDLGVISESTPDSGKVGIRTYMTANPNLVSLRGITRDYNETIDGPSSLISTTALLAPAINHDDGKRVNFTSVQNSSTVSAKGYQILPFRTGAEQVIANRAGKMFASTSKNDGIVKDLNDRFLTIEYVDGNKEVFEVGKKHGVVSGMTVPHTLITDLKIGDKVRKDDVVVYNSGFFARDIFDKGMVSYKAGVIAKVALWESSDTIEDGCVINASIIDKLSTPTAYCKPMIIDFETNVHNLVKVGDKVEYDSILCTLEDAISSGLSDNDPEAIAALRQISASNPKAKTHGTVSAIEVVYYGEFEEMTPTLQNIVKEDNMKRKLKSVTLKDGSAETGKIDEAIHWGGTKLLEGNVGIKIYIDKDLGITSGDKLVFANALKTTISKVDINPVVTEDGQTVDAIFGYQSIADRIVVSPEISGTMNVILKKLSSEMVNIYRKG